jgi:hypothetical protein
VLTKIVVIAFLPHSLCRFWREEASRRGAPVQWKRDEN